MQDEPDYRFSLANERTFLAWIRTALGLLAAAVAVVHLVPDLGPELVRLAIGLILAVLALLLSATSHHRFRRNDDAIRAGAPLPRDSLPAILAAGVSGAVVVAIVLMLTNH